MIRAAGVRLTLLTSSLIVLFATAVSAAPARRAVAPFDAIAAAEDGRRWSDGVLQRMLSHPDGAVRARAALAAGRLQDSAAVPALLPRVGDADPRVRREAAFALGQIGHRSAVATLVRALDDADAMTAERALEALGKLQDRSATPAVVRGLAHADARRRATAAVALWRLADSSAIEPLLARRLDPDPEVRWRVVYALEKVPSPDLVVRPLAESLGDPDPLVRAHAARSIGRQKWFRGTVHLVGAFQDADDAVVVNAVRGVQQIADTTFAGSLGALTRLLDHTNPHVRVTAATALAEPFGWAVALPASVGEAERALERGLTDLDPATRGACARALLVRRGPAAWPLVAPLAGDSVVYVRTAVLEAFRAMPAGRLAADPALSARVLTESFGRSRPLLERMTAAEIAGVLLGRHAGAAISPMLDALRQGIHDPDVLIAASCAGALADAGDSASVPRLAAAFAQRGRDADADARIAMRDALRALAGRAYADSVERRHAAPASPARVPPGFAKPAAWRGAVLHTDAGDITWEFFAVEATQTVKNFARLAQAGYFDGLRVHRVVPDFVLQDGDPTGTGSGGPGFTIRCEYNALRYEAGMVGMALSGKDTGGSQWFITLAPQPHLDGRYTIFARVTQGLDVARRITQGMRIRRVELLR